VQAEQIFQSIQNNAQTLNPAFQAAGAFAALAEQRAATPTPTLVANSGQSTQSTNTGETVNFVVDIVIFILVLAFIMLIVLTGIAFHRTFIKSERLQEYINADKKGMLNIAIAIKNINGLIAGIGTWWSNLRAARKGKEPSQPKFGRLPESIKVIKQNTTKPLVMHDISCPNCGNNVRASATFCPKCGFSLAPPRAAPQSTIYLYSDTTEPVSDKLSAIEVSGELDEEAAEIIHMI